MLYTSKKVIRTEAELVNIRTCQNSLNSKSGTFSSTIALITKKVAFENKKINEK